MASWGEVLDELELRIARQGAALEHDPAAIEPFVAPDNLGPLPAALRPRAVALLGASRRLESRAAELLGSMTREQGLVAAMRNEREPQARFFDRRL